MDIIDLDGCISDDRWRRKLIGIDRNSEAPDDVFAAYHARCGDDLPCDLVIDTLRLRERDNYIIVTGRPEIVRPQTEAWLKRHRLRPIDIIMRDGPDLSTVEFKKKAALTLQSIGYDIDSAYDDREDVVEAYRSLGIRSRVINLETFSGQ